MAFGQWGRPSAQIIQLVSADLGKVAEAFAALRARPKRRSAK